jgi:transposase-like protein
MITSTEPMAVSTEEMAVRHAEIARYRLGCIEAVERGMEAGLSLRKACKHHGFSLANISRWRRAYQEGGLDALRPKTEACGRMEKFSLSAAEVAALRYAVLVRQSLPLAIEDFLRHPDCRPETRAALMEEKDRAARLRRPECWPMSLRRAARVSAEEEALFRGAKHAQELEGVTRRGDYWVDESGRRLEMRWNTIYVSDDFSSNEPFRYTPPGGVETVGRQTLATMSVHAGAWLGCSPIGRERDAYRVEDIADHMGDVIAQHGLPLAWRLERGPWQNTFVDGIEVDGPEGRVTWGGLSALFHIHRVFRSRGKGEIETGFDFLQSLMAHRSTSIGRVRGEHEAGTKLYLAAQRGDPRALAAFWDIGAYAADLAAAMREFNSRPKQRRAHGRTMVVPDELMRGAPSRPLNPNDAWRLCPVKKAATVRKGCIETVVPHYPLPFRFQVNGVEPGLYLEHGHAVLIAFHPARPERGCHVFNGDFGVRNRDGLRFGQPLLIAPMAADAPQINLRPDAGAHQARRQANASVRREFRGILSAGHVHHQAPRRVSSAHDGLGQRETVETGTRTPDSVQPVPVRARPPTLDPRAEQAEIARLLKLEAEARARGDILV